MGKDQPVGGLLCCGFKTLRTKAGLSEKTRNEKAQDLLRSKETLETPRDTIPDNNTLLFPWFSVLRGSDSTSIKGKEERLHPAIKERHRGHTKKLKKENPIRDNRTVVSPQTATGGC